MPKREHKGGIQINYIVRDIRSKVRAITVPPKLDEISPKWDKYVTFEDQFQYTLARHLNPNIPIECVPQIEKPR